MRYAIEQTRLSERNDTGMRISVHKEDAPSPVDAFRRFSIREHFELLGDLKTFGRETIATARRNDDIFLVRVSADDE